MFSVPSMPEERVVDMLRGQSVLIQVPSGASLYLRRGRLAVQEVPGWFGGEFVPQARLLAAGAVCVVERRTWLRLDALGASQLCWRYAVAQRQPLWQRVLAVMSRGFTGAPRGAHRVGES